MGSKMIYNNANLVVNIQPANTFSLCHSIRLIYAVLTHVTLSKSVKY